MAEVKRNKRFIGAGIVMDSASVFDVSCAAAKTEHGRMINQFRQEGFLRLQVNADSATAGETRMQQTRVLKAALALWPKVRVPSKF